MTSSRISGSKRVARNGPVGGLGDVMQQRGELQHLPISATGEVRRVDEAGVLEAPEQLDAVGEAQDLLTGGGGVG